MLHTVLVDINLYLCFKPCEKGYIGKETNYENV
jgi:hypothetical protein